MTTLGNIGAVQVPKKLATTVSLFCVFAITALQFENVFAQQQTSSASTATLVIEALSTSSANRGKNYNITHYADENCSKRGDSDKVLEKKYAKDKHVFNALAVDTETSLVFQVAYNEKRRDGARSCTNIANVALNPGRTYTAVYNVIEEVIGCELKVYDVTDSSTTQTGSATVQNQNGTPSELTIPADWVEVDYTKPEFTCKKLGQQGFKNGTPVYSYKNRLG